MDWIDLYDEGCTTVYRHNNINVANSAAIWANQKYMSEYRNATYRITNDLFSFSETYCSKIVWQAYYYVEPIGTYGRDPYPVGVVTPGMLPNQITGVSLNGSYGV